jgi:hypothetical protein
MGFLNTPEDYEALGVEPPTSEVHGTEDDLQQARLMDGHICSWKQQGSDVFCERGPHRHGRHVPPTHLLVGTDPAGTPLYKIIDIG